MKQIYRIACLALCGLGSALQAEDLSDYRFWQSADGRQIEAKVLKIDPATESVNMQRADGLRFTLAWERLAAKDQAILEAASQEAPKATDTHPTQHKPAAPAELPDKFILKDVPMVTQKGNFCVPASAAMIAGFHGLKTDQDEVAELSSEMSASNQGTYPSDMLHAMQKLGFQGESLHWDKMETFQNTVLPRIRAALVETGPIYISFKSGVFGSMGHGCVIIGYDDRKEELYFHNPWGHEFEKAYSQVALDGRGVVFIEAPKAAPIASDAFVSKVQSIVPTTQGNFIQLDARLSQNNLPHELVWCSRRDSRDDKRFARDTARDDGRKILELAFERNPAVLIPYSPNGVTEKYFFVTRPPEGGARFLVRTIDAQGWSEPELQTLGRLTRNWVSSFEVEGSREKVWELPMIELHPDPSL